MTSERTDRDDLEDRLNAIADELEAETEITGFEFNITSADDVDADGRVTAVIGETEAEAE